MLFLKEKKCSCEAGNTLLILNRVDFFPNLNSSLEIIVKGVTMAKMRYMYGTKFPNLIGL